MTTPIGAAWLGIISLFAEDYQVLTVDTVASAGYSSGLG